MALECAIAEVSSKSGGQAILRSLVTLQKSHTVDSLFARLVMCLVSVDFTCVCFAELKLSSDTRYPNNTFR